MEPKISFDDIIYLELVDSRKATALASCYEWLISQMPILGF